MAGSKGAKGVMLGALLLLALDVSGVSESH